MRKPFTPRAARRPIFNHYHHRYSGRASLADFCRHGRHRSDHLSRGADGGFRSRAVDPLGSFDPGAPPYDSDQLVVLASDANGNPVPGTLVTFTVTSGAGLLQSPNGPQSVVVVPANSSGQARHHLHPPVAIGSFPGFKATWWKPVSAFPAILPAAPRPSARISI